MNHSMCSCQGAETKQFNISGGNDEGVPPVPIPNTEVKPFSAESTWLDTAREDRSLPESIWKKSQGFFFFCVREEEMWSFLRRGEWLWSEWVHGGGGSTNAV